jgi:hypothetical protein
MVFVGLALMEFVYIVLVDIGAMPVVVSTMLEIVETELESLIGTDAEIESLVEIEIELESLVGNDAVLEPVFLVHFTVELVVSLFVGLSLG